jgi:sporulation protein YlmC with PRC-barrel domain
MDKLPEDNFTHDLYQGRNPNYPLKYLAATSIIGDKVHDEKDAHMGDIKDIMIEVTTGKIHYYVIELGGFLGIGKKYFAIPFCMLKVDADKKIFIFTGPKEKLVNAPGFNHLHWPDTDFHLTQEIWTLE